jgi:hypothetical protein
LLDNTIAERYTDLIEEKAGQRGMGGIV